MKDQEPKQPFSSEGHLRKVLSDLKSATTGSLATSEAFKTAVRKTEERLNAEVKKNTPKASPK
jgi:hypothetical protein